MNQTGKRLWFIFIVVHLMANEALTFWGNGKSDRQSKAYLMLEDEKGAALLQNGHDRLNEPHKTGQEQKEIQAKKKKILQLLSNPERADYLSVIKLFDSLEDINEPLHSSKSRPLELALKKPHNLYYLTIVSALLDRGANIHLSDVLGQTPLMLALYMAPADAYVAIVQWLLDMGSDINAKDIYGWTPLMYALRHAPQDSYLATAQLLLEKGASVKVAQKDGITPLMFALTHAPRDDYLAVARLLLEKGADVHKVDVAGFTALTCVVRHAPPSIDVELVHELVKRGVTDFANPASWHAYYMNKPDVFAHLILLSGRPGYRKLDINPDLKLSSKQKKAYMQDMDQILGYINSAYYVNSSQYWFGCDSGYPEKIKALVHRTTTQLLEHFPERALNLQYFYPALVSAARPGL